MGYTINHIAKLILFLRKPNKSKRTLRIFNINNEISIKLKYHILRGLKDRIRCNY